MSKIIPQAAKIPTEARLARLPKTMELTGVKRSSLYAMVKAGQFPKPIKLSSRCSAWVVAELEEWIASKIAE